jgi:iron complex transport system substrate-binding protein
VVVWLVVSIIAGQ